MDTQLDEIAIGILKPCGAQFLSLLKEKILARRQEDWYEIHLAVFIVMSDMEQILHDVQDFTQRFGMKVSLISNSSTIRLTHHRC
jgi:hypothetical protein